MTRLIIHDILTYNTLNYFLLILSLTEISYYYFSIIITIYYYLLLLLLFTIYYYYFFIITFHNT